MQRSFPRRLNRVGAPHPKTDPRRQNQHGVRWLDERTSLGRSSIPESGGSAYSVDIRGSGSPGIGSVRVDKALVTAIQAATRFALRTRTAAVDAAIAATSVAQAAFVGSSGTIAAIQAALDVSRLATRFALRARTAAAAIAARSVAKAAVVGDSGISAGSSYNKIIKFSP